ncbi:hypothetical protein [Amycolatopsis sp. YIM 10]|uniref:hypothetical protein n=1 Tax=Amycolatopsis sp. YIM 10 TaxID=2653857 RepID=UPI0012901235|nr:hypothetical protein [Amycolatopsis sp. YIM 10]QFU94350.1 hypothetical protein YIM_46120 [Amycolatopsis sp. YIM 10]
MNGLLSFCGRQTVHDREAARTTRKTAPQSIGKQEKWWVVEVEGVGAPQGRSTAEAQRMAARWCTAC